MEVLASRYELDTRLGGGGMAVVFAARDRILDRRVAVKLVREDIAADPVMQERLLREARAAARLSHPNAVAVFDVDEDGGRPFIVMELVDGQTLADRLASHGPLAPEEAVDIAERVLAALGAAHAQGLVHRDVKPANILLPAGGGAKLADFGIAKLLAEAAASLTASGQVLATPRYASPEQIAGQPATPRSDLYSVGVVLYEMLAGRPPFSGEALAVAAAQQSEPAPPLTTRRPDLPPALAAAVHRALEKEPARRYAGAAQMQAALRGGALPDPAGQPQADETVVMGGPGGALAPPETPAATRTLPPAAAAAAARRPIGTPSPPRRQGVVLAVTIAALLVLAAVGLGLSDDRGDTSAGQPAPNGPQEPGGQADAPQDESPADRADPAPPDDAHGPGSLEDLAALVAAEPQRHGSKGEDLAKALDKVLEERGRKRFEKAREAAEDVEEWLAEGELDPGTGHRALELLAPLAERAPSDDD